MMSTSSKFIIFAVGAAIGSAVTWLLLRAKYEQDLKAEIDSLTTYYEKQVKVVEDAAKTLYDVYRGEDERKAKKEASTGVDTDGDKEEINDVSASEINERVEENRIDTDRYRKVLEDHKYSHSDPCEDDGINAAPYVISPDEFGEADDYDMISLTYYADKVLADDWNDPIEDIEATVGSDSLTHFGEYEEDSVFVRNDRLRVDYEILLSNLKFSDVVKNDPSAMKE